MHFLRSAALDRRLYSFPFGKGGSGVLVNCSLCGTKATLFFLAGPVCSSFSAEACPILQAFALYLLAAPTILPLLFSYLTLVLSSPPCPLLHLSFYLNISGRSGTNCLLSPPFLSGYKGSPDTPFSRRSWY